MLAISQWTIIMSLLYALVFKDWLPDLQEKLRVKNDYLYGVILFAAAFIIGGAIGFLLFYINPYISPEGYDTLLADPKVNIDRDMWHHVLYQGTFPLIPAILLGVYTKNFSNIGSSGARVLRRVAVLIPAIIVLYFAYHWLIARPEVLINFFSDGAVDKGFGLFGEPNATWYHQLGLYFNFTVSIIPLTHHWFCGKAGFMKEVPDEPVEGEAPGRRYARPREQSVPEASVERPIRKAERRAPRESYGYRDTKANSRRGWR